MRSSPAASSTEKQALSTRLIRHDALSEVIAWTSYAVAPGKGSQQSVHVDDHVTRSPVVGVAVVAIATRKLDSERLSTNGAGVGRGAVAVRYATVAPAPAANAPKPRTKRRAVRRTRRNRPLSLLMVRRAVV